MRKRRSQRAFNPSLTLRITSVLVALIVVSSVIATGITIAVITDKVQVSSTVVVVTEANITVAVQRSIRVNESDEFYEPSQTLEDLDRTLNERIQQSLPNSAIKAIITAFADQPMMITEERSSFRDDPSPALKNRSWIVLFNATAFFNRSYTSLQMQTAMEDYQVLITLLNLSGQPSAGVGTISLKYSIFRNTVPTTLTVEAVNQLHSISLARRTTTSTVTAPLVITGSCSPSIQSYLSITFERPLASNERLTFFDPLATRQDLTTNLRSRIQSSFPGQSIQLDILLFSAAPSLIYDATNSQVQTVIITVVGIASFLQNTSGTAIRIALMDDRQSITLLDSVSQPSTALASFSSNYSLITDALPRQTTGELLSELSSLCQTTQRLVYRLLRPAANRAGYPDTTTTSTNVTTTTSSIVTSMPIGNTEPVFTITPTTVTTEPNTTQTTPTTIAVNQCQSFFEAYISVSLIRIVGSNERAQLYDIPTTMQDLYTTLRSNLQSYFLQVFVQLKMFTMSDGPRIIPASNQSIIVNILASVYWTEVQSNSRIIASLENYNLSISLLTGSGQSSSQLAVFSSSYSITQDASLLQQEDSC